MGSFLGHVIPGTFFIIISIWWTIAIYFRHARANKSNTRFRSSLAYGKVANIPVESFVKLVFSTLGVIGEAVTGFNSDGSWNIGNGQHITMFSFFGLQALLEVFAFYNFPVPPHLDYASSMLAFLMEGILFVYHLHGRTPLDVLVHTFLVYTIFAGSIAVALEAAFRHSPIFALFRAFTVLVQGTWFYHVGFILYPPLEGMQHWDEHNHQQMMVITMMFTWHCAADLILMLVIGTVVTSQTRRLQHSGISLSMHSLLPKKQQEHNHHNHSILNPTDSESDGI